MMRRAVVTIIALGSVAGCASHPSDIQQQYVSDNQYASYTCQQLSEEEGRISRRVSALHGSLEKKASNDSVQMGIGLILFWPTLFLLEGGDGPEAQEYARMKGEHEALERVAIKKDCGLAIVPMPEQIKKIEEEERKRQEDAQAKSAV